MTGNSHGRPLDWYLLNWLVPALFALLVSAVIRFHSLMPVPTMPRMVGNLLALDGVSLLGLMALGRRVMVPRDIALLLLALAASAIISVLGSGDANTSLLRLELYVSIALLATVFCLLYRDAGQVPLAGMLLAVSLVHLPFLLSAVQWISHLQPPYWQDGPRVADFGHVRQFAEFSFFAAVCATALGVILRRMVWPSLILATLALFGIVLTGSRGALVAWMLFSGLAFCICRCRLRVGLLTLIPLLVAALAVWYLDQSGLMHSPNIFSRVVQVVQDQGAGFDSGRMVIWTASLKQIALHPIFGSGPEGFWLTGCCSPTYMQAHNFVLQLLIEFGAMGCGIVALILFRITRRVGGMAGGCSLVLATPENRVLACMIVAYLAYSLIDQTMYHLLPLLLIAPVVGMFAAGLAQAHRSATAAV